jgi:hypothetical protein
MSDNYAASILNYGSTGTLKTTNVGHFAKYVYETTHAPTRLVFADNGGWEPIEPYIKAGIIMPYRLRDNPTLLEQIRLLMKGHWPDESGNFGKEPNLDNVGANAAEGLTSISMLVLRHLVMKGQKISEDIVGTFREGNEVFGAAGRSHYGFVQQFILDFIGAFSTLPTLSKRVMFTAHEGKGQDSQTRQTVYGPSAVGQAITDKIPFFVGDLIHSETTVLDAKKNLTTVRAYFKSHADADLQSIIWPAKARLPFDLVEEFNKKWPDGYLDLSKENLYDYLKFMDSVRLKSADSIMQWKEQLTKGATK